MKTSGWYFLLVPLSFVAMWCVNGQTNEQGQVPKRTLSSQRIAQLLREPNGLEAAANLVGNFEINGQIHSWSNVSLKTLVSGSSLIVLGEVESRSSYLLEDGDAISTDYTVQPTKVLKGAVKGEFNIALNGGRITFPTGNTAQVTTIEWQHLQVGQSYLFFLQQEKDGTVSLTNGIESLFRVSTADGYVDALVNHDSGPHSIKSDVKDLTEAAFVSKIQALIGH